MRIVGAIGRVSNIGLDLGKVAGLDYPLNVKINHNADAVLSEQGADIAVVSISTGMEQMYTHIEKCVKNGLNVITSSEEALYPWETSPELTSKLDKLAKKHGVTISASGTQDVFWVNLVTVLTGVSHTIESITGKVQFDTEPWGSIALEMYFLGETKETFNKAFSERPLEPSYLRTTFGAICADLGLTITKMKQRVEPIIYDEDVESLGLGKTVKKGLVTGRSTIVEAATAQGVRLHGEEIGKIFGPNDTDLNEWVIKGVPNLYLTNEKVPTEIGTVSQLVNRIPDVINAEAGFITCEKLPKLKYRAHPLHYYLRR